MDFNNLLTTKQIDPREVLVLRHRPTEPELRKWLPWFAAEEPETFNAYQQTQGARVENALLSSQYVASFIGQEPGKAVFIGLYAVGKHRPLTREEFWKVPAYARLKPLGMRGFAEEDDRNSVLWFDLAEIDFYAAWKGKLIVGWPPPERAWWRRAYKNTIPIAAILEESLLTEVLPKWDEINFSWLELSILPSRLKADLSQWRGIYFIFDESDGKGYVGSAYGAENLFGRWRNYAATGHGGNRLLRERNPTQLRFSILQRVSPDMEPDEVIQLESKWKERLHTRAPQGLNDN